MNVLSFLSWRQWPQDVEQTMKRLPRSVGENVAATPDSAQRNPDPQDPAWKTFIYNDRSLLRGGADIVTNALAWFSGHLQHGADGHLIHARDGHLSSGCSSGSVCPTMCHACAPTLTLTVAGIGGAGPACCIPALNGTFTLTQIGNDCNYSTGLFPQPRGCSFGWGLTCQSLDCNGVAGAGRWVLQLYGNITFVWAQLFPSSPCPPTGAFTICANPCTGGAGATLVLS